MADVFSADFDAMDAHAAAHRSAGATFTRAGSVDSAAMLGAAAEALGPFGSSYLDAYAPLQAYSIAATQLLGDIHTAVADHTTSAKAAFAATDNG